MKLLSHIPARTNPEFRPFPGEALEQSIPERFDEIVRVQGRGLALQWRDGRHAYASLDAATNRLARTLSARNIDAAVPVAVLFSHGGEALVTILAVLKAGRFYVVRPSCYGMRRDRKSAPGRSARLP